MPSGFPPDGRGLVDGCTQEFKDELCREVINTSRPTKDVATAYGVGPETLRNWLNKTSRPTGAPRRT